MMLKPRSHFATKPKEARAAVRSKHFSVFIHKMTTDVKNLFAKLTYEYKKAVYNVYNVLI